MPDYEIEVSGKTYEMHSDKPLAPADIAGVVAKFKKQSAAPPRPAVSPTDRKPSPFHLRSTTPTTIGPPHPEEKPNLLQQAAQGLGHVLGLPSGLAAAAAMQPIGGKSLTGALSAAHKPQAGAGASRLDNQRLAELQRMNMLQRANALSGQSFADPNLGRPYAQGLEQDINKAQFGHAAGPMSMLSHVATDPLSVLAVEHPIAAVAFTAQAAAGAADATARFARTHDPDDAIEAAISLAMAGMAGSHAKGQITAGRRLNALSEAIIKQGKPVPPERIARLAQRFQVDPAKLTKAVDKGTPELAKAAAKDPLVAEKPPTRKPTPKPKEDAAAKREREKVRTAAKSVPVKPAQPADKPPVTSKPRAKAKTPAVKPEAAATPDQRTEGVKKVVRYDEPGDKPDFSKPHGVYTTPAGRESPHSDLGVRSEWDINPKAKSIDIPDYGKDVVMRRGAVNAGAGVHAARHFLGDKEFARVKALSKADIVKYASEKYSGVDFSKYHDAQEVMEAIGALEAKAKGYDLFHVKDTSDPNFDETVLLSEKAVKGTAVKTAPAATPLTPEQRAEIVKKNAAAIAAKAAVAEPPVKEPPKTKTAATPPKKPPVVKTTAAAPEPAARKADAVAKAPVKGISPEWIADHKAKIDASLKASADKKAAIDAIFGPEETPVKPVSPTDKPAALKLTMAEANTLGGYHDPGDALGDALSKARKGIAITPEQQAALQKLVKEKGLSRSQFPNLYKESPKDIALREKGTQELGVNVNPFELLRKAKESQGGQAAGDFIYGQKSALTHESTPSLEAVNKHENARMTAHLQADEVLPAVTSHLSPEDSAKFGAYGVADRLLAEKNRNRQIISSAPARRRVLLREVRRATAARDAAILTHDPLSIRIAQKSMNEAQATSTGHLKVLSEAKKSLRENALERHGIPFSVTLPNGTTHVIKEADIGPFFSRPEIATALAAHKAGGEAILHSNQTRQGNLAGVSVGEHTKSYFPARAVDDTGALRRASSSKGGRHQATATMAKNMDASHFAGNAHSYATDYHEYMRDAMAGSLSRATEREMHNTLLKEGAMVPFDKSNPDLQYTDGKLEIRYKGKWEPAYEFSIQKGESRDPRLPDRVVMPSRLYAELQPLFDPQVQTLTDQMANSAMGGFMRTYLMAPADAMQHTAALSGRAAYGAARAVSPTDRPIVTGIKQAGRGLVAPFQSAINFVRFWNPNLYDGALRTRALKSMSEAGVLPSNFGDTGKVPGQAPPKNMLDRRNWTIERAKHPGHNVLYGDRGVLSNAGTAVYKIFEDQGALKTEAGRSMLHQALRETFNTYSKTDRAGLSKVASTFGGGSFYETGLKNRTTAFSAGKHVYAASLASRALLVVAAVRSATGKNPWDIPGYKWGYVPVWKDPKTGEVLMFDAKVLDRIGFYPDQMVFSVLQNTYDVKQKRISARAGALELGTEAANFAAAPVVSGPVPALASNITGKLPYVYPDRTLSGIEFADNPSKKLGMTWKRGVSLAVTALPLASALSIDPAHDMVASTPKSKDAEKINRVLRIMGIPQLRTGIDPKVVEKRRAAAEKGAERADAKALGKSTSRSAREESYSGTGGF